MIIGGLGYATEAAQAALRYAFDVLELSEVIAFTAVINKRSQKLM
ncbi:GNAT family N-acetyltransferase, partial [Pseudoalteromonas sp. 41-MNA-CIBAN-0057]